MNRIILAYCHENTELAAAVEQQLSRIGIPFEHITDLPDEAAASFSDRLKSSDDPVVIFLTDNFFKSRSCMTGALSGVQSLLRGQRMLAVVADGKVSHDGGATFEYVETHFDRMVYALQYMNYWQNAWLDLSSRHQHAEGEEKNALEAELNITRNIANEMGELISVLREAGYVTWEQLQADDFALFFRQFGLQEWHAQYRQLATSAFETIPPLPSAPAAALAETPVVTGLLMPEPAESLDDEQITMDDAHSPGLTEWVSDSKEKIAEDNGQQTSILDFSGPLATEEGGWIATDGEKGIANGGHEPVNEIEEDAILAMEGAAGDNGHFNGMDTLLREMEGNPDAETYEEDAGFAEIPVSPPDEETKDVYSAEFQIEQAVRDAWDWMEKGHVQRGLELLQFTHEQYPENKRLQEEYATAVAQFAAPTEPEEKSEHHHNNSSAHQSATDNDELLTNNRQQTDSSEAQSYDLMGDMAAEKGDYLFAKYCWDRTAEIEPDYPGIFRKLGLMTSEHLRDYRETAVHYLQKAVEHDPNDADVHLALAGAALQNDDLAQAESWYAQAVLLNPALRTPDNDRLFRPAATAMPEPQMAENTPVTPVAEAAPSPQPALEKREVLTVLITGATSGIGKATAEIFARHGHRVILTGRRIERLVLLKTQFEEEYHSEVLMLPFDVREQGAVQAALNNLPESWQNIDILVNNAGLAKGFSPIEEGNLDHWEAMIDTNVKGLLYVTRAVAPGMVQRRRGQIINIGSSAGKEVYPSGNVYCATKFAVDALTRAMRLDLHKHNIRVGQVSPGHVEETEFAITRFDGDAERARIYDDFQPLKSSDVAEVIYFMVTRPPHVNIQDVQMFAAQQASSTVIDRSGRH